MPTQQITAILRKEKGKYDTRHHRPGAKNKKQFKHLIERISAHDVVQEQSGAQKQNAGADRPRCHLRYRSEEKREDRKAGNQLHPHAQPAYRLVPLNDKDHANQKDEQLTKALRQNPARGARGDCPVSNRLIGKRGDAGENKIDQHEQQTPGRSAGPEASCLFSRTSQSSHVISDRGSTECLRSCQNRLLNQQNKISGCIWRRK